MKNAAGLRLPWLKDAQRRVLSGWGEDKWELGYVRKVWILRGWVRFE